MAMFKKEKVELDMQSISTLISEGCIFDGNLKAPGVARIDGQITGDVMAEEGLIIGEKGSILGSVSTKDMVIYGTINGNVQTNSLEIRATGKVHGDIRTQSLAVENGAVYNGNLNMTHNTKIAPHSSHKQPELKVIEV